MARAIPLTYSSSEAKPRHLRGHSTRGDRGVGVTLEHEAARAGEVIRSFSDISKARGMLGWAPTHSLEAGLEKTVDWFLATRGEGAGG